MKLLSYKSESYPVKASLVTNNKKQHFNIKHGTRLKDGWQLTFGVDDNIVKNEIDEQIHTIELLDSDYILLPIINKHTNEQVRDKIGNRKFFISRNSANQDNTLLLFLSLPSKQGVICEITGNAKVISVGKNYDYVNDEKILTDAPVIYVEDTSIITIKYEEDDKIIIDRLTVKDAKITSSKEIIQKNKEGDV